MDLSRREAIRRLAAMASGLALPTPLAACRGEPPSAEDIELPAAAAELRAENMEDELRLHSWVETLIVDGLASRAAPFGAAVARVGELAIGTPYEGFSLEAYIRAGGSPSRTEPLTLSLTRFDCVSLVEACIAIARMTRRVAQPSWEVFATEMERMRYRDGRRGGYSSRLHYFSEWLDDNARRGLVRNLSEELGGEVDTRPLRFMSSNPDAYPALAFPEVREEIAAMERRLDDMPRHVIPRSRIPQIADRLESGDILAFATSIAGLDVTHAAFAYRDEAGALRVLHAPLSGGEVEVTGTTVPEYVAAIRQSTGILVARPLDG